MVRASVWLPVLAAAAFVACGNASAAPPPPGPLTFKDARLGMTLEAWRQAPFPGAPNPRVAPSCHAGEAGGGPELDRASTAPGPASQTCAYVSRYGSVALSEDVPWSPDVLAKSPRYVFTGGRLSRIDIHVDIDAFDKIMARLKARYGPPASVVRDNVRTRAGVLPRVTVRWNTAAGGVLLVDPSADLGNMMISFLAAPARARTVASAASGAGS